MDRLDRCRKTMRGNGVQAMLCTSYHNKFYLAGLYSSSGYVLVTPRDAYVLVDPRYFEEMRRKNPPAHVLLMDAQHPYDRILREIFDREDIASVGFEGDVLPYSRYEALRRTLAVTWKPVDVNPIRFVKEEAELSSIRKACSIADEAFSHILPFLKAGLREDEVANELVYFMKKAGAAKESFDVIVASGKNGAMPHAKAGAKRIEAGDFVTMDFGARVDQYCSDMTRTVAVGHVEDPKLLEIYEVVRRAQEAGVRAVGEGKRFCDADRAARRIIEEAGYGESFGHNLGHSVGINDHEEPCLSPTEMAPMQAGMVVTVEPGVYVPGLGGVRIEDDILVTPGGGELLTRSPRDLMTVDKEQR